ncbi:hypothetical protein KQ41_06845 [Lysinibacillus fusiformis]|uniref:Uncharacterized protein n=2 Tax=Bacillaceae TaxID=186817 RepID=B1I096_LYSSC|nr:MULTISPECIES: hypothetical protein [Lysinibacillus]ACA42255.1 hypothetical protein Bsph_p025 [Lysinibacillus sphaericus C3-41]AMO35399.1 hypothetical protein AR327_23190 [Lysinibacillus sphaericus]AMR93168.1 hypothetical protein A1T07_23465 [Lysinibacillus sphaericus]KGA83748.1 hypothetical protein KQ41_06845 [Lysinibacillus fusiformis]MBG9710655.1 hypothetical protein [Lysinibacillus sphaericus]
MLIEIGSHQQLKTSEKRNNNMTSTITTTTVCVGCNKLDGYISIIYVDKETKEYKAECAHCKNVFTTTFEPTTQQNFGNKIDEELEQEQIKALLEGSKYLFLPDADDKDVILAFRVMLENGEEPTNKEAFNSMYHCVISNSVHEFETNDLHELLDRPDDLYYDYGVGSDCETIEWLDINIDVRYLYLINNTFYYYVG